MRQIVALLLISSPAIAKKKVMYEESASGAVWAVDGAKLKTLGPVTVRLECVTSSEPGEDNHWRSACDSTLRVERDGKLVAKGGAPGIDFQQVAGNSGGLSLSLVGPFIQVAARSQEGDEQMRSQESATLYVVDKKTLREVFSYQALDAFEPGPDGKDEDRVKTTRELSADEEGRLTLTSGEEVVKVEWDGKKLVEGASLSSPEPLVARVLAGQRLKAEELKPINKDGLAKLRNAPYARHGRPFKNPSLQSYFYGGGKLKPNPAFSEAQLDAADKANLSLIIAEIKSR